MSGKVKPGYKQTEVGVIPEEWEAVSLGEGIKLFSGQHVLARHCNTDGDGAPYITGPADFPNGVIRHSKSTTRPGTICREHDVLVTVKGSGAGTLVLSDADYCISRQLMAIRVSGWDTRYIYYSLLRDSSLFSAAATGLIPGLSRADILNKNIPLPPTKTEQGAIAEALSDADVLIESLEQLITKKRNIKQGVMQALLTGKKRLPGFSGEWKLKTLGKIGEALIGLTYKPSDVRSDGVLVLRSSNVNEGELRFEDNVFVAMDIPERIMVRTGDILICVRNGSRDLIGKCVNIDERAQGMTFGAFMAVFRTPFHKFVYHQFQSDVIKRQIHEHLGATINQITNKSLNSFQIQFPMDEEEQTAIATVLSDMDAEIAALEAKLGKARQIKQGMMQELLTGRIRLI